MRKIILDIGFSPGDIVVFTRAVRDLCEQYPDYEVDIQSPCSAIFENNPYVNKREKLPPPEIVPDADNLVAAGFDLARVATDYKGLFTELMKENKLEGDFDEEKKVWNYTPKEGENILFWCKQVEPPDVEAEYYRIKYDDIHNSGSSGRHFSNAFFIELEEILKVPVKQTSLLPDIHISEEERGWISQVEEKFHYKGNFWLINAGHKNDYPLKQWGPDYWQELVELLKNKVQFVQIGENSKDHEHFPLDGCLNLIGDTDLRELIRLTYHADGAISHVSLLHHLMAAWQKPCVTIAGGREAAKWENYPNGRYLQTNGLTSCASYDGCWLSGRVEAKENKKCKNTVGGWPRCMRMITPEMVAKEVENYVDNHMPLHSKLTMKIRESKNEELVDYLKKIRDKL